MSAEPAEDRQYKWEIEPHFDSDYDVFVTDDDQQAREMLLAIAEQLWDAMITGEERVIKIRLNF